MTMPNLLSILLLGTTVLGTTIVEIPDDIGDGSETTNTEDSDEVIISHIVGGDRADRGEYPWLINLWYNDVFYCGGSILDERTVLTAAHCVEDDPKQREGKFFVKAGDYKTFNPENSEQLIRVSKVIMHSKYNRVSILDRDIAILKLAKPLVMTKYVQTVPLASKNKEKQLLANPNCFVAGVGYTENWGDRPVKTKELKVTMPTRKACFKEAKVYKPPFTKYMICSNDENEGACYGDSGGPLTCFDTNDDPFLVGVVSWGSIDCWIGFNVYARVSMLKAWTKKYLE